MSAGRPGRTGHARRVGRARRAAGALALVAALAACAGDGDGSGGEGGGGGDGGGAPELAATDAFVPEPVSADLAAGFLTVANTGGADDALTAVTSDTVGSVELHETSDGAMRQVSEFPVPAGGELRLERGGDHLMLHDLDPQPREGDTVTLRLHFATADPITVEAPVEAATHTGH